MRRLSPAGKRKAKVSNGWEVCQFADEVAKLVTEVTSPTSLGESGDAGGGPKRRPR